MRLANGVYVIGGGGLGYGLSDYYDCNVYAVETGEEIALIDAGAGIEPELLLRRLDEDGLPRHRVRKLLLTHAHADHSGGAAFLKERLGVEVIAPEPTAEMVESGDEIRTSLADARRDGVYPEWYRLPVCKVDRKVRAEDVIRSGGLTFRVVPAPGHSFDMVCYYCPEWRALFAADAVFAGGKLAVIRTPDFSLDDYRRTILGLARLDVNLLFPGHGSAVTEHAREAIAAAHLRFEQGLPPLSIV